MGSICLHTTHIRTDICIQISYLPPAVSSAASDIRRFTVSKAGGSPYMTMRMLTTRPVCVLCDDHRRSDVRILSWQFRGHSRMCSNPSSISTGIRHLPYLLAFLSPASFLVYREISRDISMSFGIKEASLPVVKITQNPIMVGP